MLMFLTHQTYENVYKAGLEVDLPAGQDTDWHQVTWEQTLHYLSGSHEQCDLDTVCTMYIHKWKNLVNFPNRLL